MAGTVVISTGEYPPFCGSCLPHHGFINHVVKRSFERVGMNVRFEYYPWARAFKLASSGAVPAVSYVYNTEQRRKDFLVSELITYEKIHFMLPGSISLKGGNLKKSLRGMTVGLTVDYSQPEEFMKLVDAGAVKYEYAKNDRLNIAKLLKARIDAVLINKNVGTIILEKYFPDEIKTVYFDKKFMFRQQGVLGFPLHHPDSVFLQRKFNEGLRQVRKSGEYEKMFKDFLKGEYSECR